MQDTQTKVLKLMACYNAADFRLTDGEMKMPLYRLLIADNPRLLHLLFCRFCLLSAQNRWLISGRFCMATMPRWVLARWLRRLNTFVFFYGRATNLIKAFLLNSHLIVLDYQHCQGVHLCQAALLDPCLLLNLLLLEDHFLPAVLVLQLVLSPP